jgi:5'-nucleotidase
MGKAERHFADLGIDVHEQIYTLPEPWDALEQTVRTRQCLVGQVVCKSMLAQHPEAEVVFFQSGMLRLDDVVEGSFRAWDAIRLLPFGGGMKLVEMRGDVLRRCVDMGQNIPTDGGYLQRWGINLESGGIWLVNNQLLNDSLTYKVVTTDFLLEGRESEFDFLKSNPEVRPIDNKNSSIDLRVALVNYLKSKK